MEIVSVNDVLSKESLATPVLNVLVPNEDNYEVLLLQPRGDIEADINGVRNHNNELSYQQCRSFLEDVNGNKADLVVTPEYSMPWSVLVDMIKEGKGPASRKLWALGCESIKLNQLDKIKQELSSLAVVIYEQLDSSSSKFVSPLAYVFNASLTTDKNELTTVILIQFKTHAMGDEDHFEINGMQKGTIIYKFSGLDNQINLLSLICSDAFNFKDEIASEIYHRTLVLHIQLNRSPRHEVFLDCRNRLFKYGGDETELICLNWASDVIMDFNGKVDFWKNIAGSAWYLKSKQFDCRDATLCHNHKLGLYYTYFQPYRSHALFFNYKPAIFLLTATKVAHHRVDARVARRRGPQIKTTCIWDDKTSDWVAQVIMEDGFSPVISESDPCQKIIERIAEDNPFNAERVLALSSGAISHEKWYLINNLDSCIIDLKEIIKRITFAQDTHDQANYFRNARLIRFCHLWNILSTGDLPPGIQDLKKGFDIQWSKDSPHQNVTAINGKATVIYMGEESSTDNIYNTTKSVEKFIENSPLNRDEKLSALQRVHVWFRDKNGKINLYEQDRHVKFNRAGDESSLDFGREE